jgi:hypothetical protein
MKQFFAFEGDRHRRLEFVKRVVLYSGIAEGLSQKEK